MVQSIELPIPEIIGGNLPSFLVPRHASRALARAIFSGHSLRSGFVTSALQAGADVLRVMDVTRHRQIATLKIYDRRAKAFKPHAGETFL